MPLIKSAIKRVRQEKRRRIRNSITKRHYKELIKEFVDHVKEGKEKEAAALYPKVQKAIDTATKKKLIHKNNAGHKKSQLAKMLTADAPKKETKAPTKKPAAIKKTTPTKTTAKKTEDK